MANGLDSSLTVAKESATGYGTYVTTTKAIEFADLPPFAENKERVKSKTLRSGGRFGLAAASPVVFKNYSTDLTVEARAKGQGVLWEMALGSAVSTLVSTGLYQQVFKMADVLPSYTMQLGLPMFNPATGAWTVNAFTYGGVMASGWELSLSNGGVLELKLSLTARERRDNVAYVDPAALYPAAVLPYHFGSACIYSGVIAEPTATGLIATAGLTAVGNVVSAGLKVENSLSTGTKRLCATGLQARPFSGKPVGSGTLVVDYVSTAWTDAIASDAPVSLVMDFLGNSADATVDHLQVLIQDLRIKDGMPTPNDGQPLQQSLSFDLFDKTGQTSPIIVVQRTADSAI